MTLDEMLALLPDNTTGAISAADIRTIVTELFNYTAEVEARVGAIETGSTGGGGGSDTISVAARWQIQNVPDFHPADGQVGCDTGSFSTASVLRFGRFDKASQDMLTVLLAATAIYGQQWDVAGNWISWDVSGTPTLVNNYIEVPVTFLKGAGTVLSAGWHDGLFVISVDTP